MQEQPKPTYIPPPKSNFKRKKVEVSNYSEAYMYPEDKVKQPTVENNPIQEESASATTIVSKDECITMLGQEKFDKYLTMFSDEAAVLKRCTMMRAMR